MWDLLIACAPLREYIEINKGKQAARAIPVKRYTSSITAFLSSVELAIILSKGGSGMDIRRNVANTLRLYMDEHNKTLLEFAEELEIARSSLQQYVKGEGNPSIGTIERMAEKMDMDSVSLLTGTLDAGQRECAWAVLTTIQKVGALPEEKRLYFVDLFLKMLQLWCDS